MHQHEMWHVYTRVNINLHTINGQPTNKLPFKSGIATVTFLCQKLAMDTGNHSGDHTI